MTSATKDVVSAFPLSLLQANRPRHFSPEAQWDERTGTRRRSDWEIDSLASRPTSTHKREVWIYKQKRRSHLQHPPPEPLFHLREHLRNLYNFTVSDRYMGGQVEKKVAEHNNNNLLFVFILLYRPLAA